MSVNSWLIDAERRRGDHWVEMVRQFFQTNPFADPDGIVFLGDSITEWYPVAQHFPGRNVINRGIAGDNITGVLERLVLSTVDLQPSKLFVMIGINDILGNRMNTEQVKFLQFGLLAGLIGQLPNTEIFIQSLLPVGPDWAAQRPVIHAVNQALVDLSGYYGLSFVDLYPAFAGPNDEIKPNLTVDGLHLSDAGYDLWTSQIQSLVNG